MIVWVALSAASGLTLLTLRSMAHAFASTVDARPHRVAARPTHRRRRGYLASGEAAMLVLDILISIGIALAIVGLAATAALPGRQLIGALLAQVAVLGSLVAPSVTVRMYGIGVRPAALALGFAQLANVLFFISAIRALV